MKQQYYEAHVTMTGHPVIVRPLVEAQGWKFSAIEGDINLGDGLKLYATRQFNAKKMTQDEVVDKLTVMALTLGSQGVSILREKVELVIYDTRSKDVRAVCEGGCPECVGLDG